jgi:hypothetical protein
MEASLAISTYPQCLVKAFGIAFTALLVDIASLLAIFLTFHQVGGSSGQNFLGELFKQEFPVTVGA